MVARRSAAVALTDHAPSSVASRRPASKADPARAGTLVNRASRVGPPRVVRPTTTTGWSGHANTPGDPLHRGTGLDQRSVGPHLPQRRVPPVLPVRARHDGVGTALPLGPRNQSGPAPVGRGAGCAASRR